MRPEILIERPNWTLEKVPVALTTVEDTPIRTGCIGHALVLFVSRETDDAPKVVTETNGTRWTVPDDGHLTLISEALLERFPSTPVMVMAKAIENGFPHAPLPSILNWRKADR